MEEIFVWINAKSEVLFILKSSNANTIFYSSRNGPEKWVISQDTQKDRTVFRSQEQNLTDSTEVSLLF